MNVNVYSVQCIRYLVKRHLLHSYSMLAFAILLFIFLYTMALSDRGVMGTYPFAYDKAI